MADTNKKVSELETASQVNNTDLMMLSQGSSQSGFASLKTTVLAFAQKIVSGINFTSDLQTESKTITGAINEVAEGGGGSSTFAGLSDVDIDDTTLVDGQVPVWDETEEKWKNGNGGGGTTVVANPTGTPTDDLNSIQIGSDIYRIVGGGGGGTGGLTKTALYENASGTLESVISLSQSIEDFDFVEIITQYPHSDDNDYRQNAIYNTEELIDSIGTTRPINWHIGNDSVYTWIYITDVDEFTVHTNTQASLGIRYVYGYKIASGGGSAEYTDVIGTLEAGDTEIVLTSSKIKTTSAVFPWTDRFGVAPTNMVVANGSVTLTFPVQSTDLGVMVRVTKVGSTPEPTPIDTTNTSKYNESSMNVVSSSSQMESVWDGGSAIGLTFYLTNPIDVTNLSKLSYELQTGSCYGGGSQAQQERWNIQIGLMSTAPSSIMNGTYSELNFAAGDDFAYSNTNYGTQEIDVSSLSGNYYLVVNAHGWNATISNLREE